MLTFPWLRWPLAAVAALALVTVVACGDDDDDDGGTGDQTSTIDNQDDSNEPTQGTDTGSGGSDEEEYVTDLCTAFLEFQGSIVQIATDPENLDATDEEGLELVREPFETLLAAVEDADPPRHRGVPRRSRREFPGDARPH